VDIAIPGGSLVVLIGVAGVGKTTFAARHFRPEEVLSSDAFRGIVGEGEWDQRASRPAFAALHRALDRRLVGGRTSVVDATNVTGWARGALLARATASGSPAIAIVLDLPLAVCLAQNRARATGARSVAVPARAIRQQFRELKRSLRDPSALLLEGFDEVYRLGSPEAIEAVRFVRSEPTGGVPGLLPLAAVTEREDPTEA
jgi:protein phosphatase